MMIKEKRTPMDLMDNIYSLAYWMTGSEIEATELVNRTYLNIHIDTPEREVFKSFRECYLDSIDEDILLRIPESPCTQTEPPVTPLRRRFADIKLSVLLSEVPGLKHRDISKIIGKPLNTIRLWLSSGRRSFADGTLSFERVLVNDATINRKVAL